MRRNPVAIRRNPVGTRSEYGRHDLGVSAVARHRNRMPCNALRFCISVSAQICRTLDAIFSQPEKAMQVVKYK